MTLMNVLLVLMISRCFIANDTEMILLLLRLLNLAAVLPDLVFWISSYYGSIGGKFV